MIRPVSLDAYHVPAASTVTSQMCVGVERTQASVRHGQAAQWVVTVYATGATTTNATVSLAAAPAGQRAAFDFGCGTQEGTAACTLGTVNVGAAVRQVQAQIKVPATSTVTAVRLTATVSADHLSAKPSAAVTVTVASGAAAAAVPPVDYLSSQSFRDPSYLPLVSSSAAQSSLSPGGNAAGLFPELTPGGTAPGSSRASASRGGDLVALSATSVSETGAQVAGLAVLMLAFLLAVMHKLEIRVAGHPVLPARLPKIPRIPRRIPRVPLHRKPGPRA